MLAVSKIFWDFLHFLTSHCFFLEPSVASVTHKIPLKMQQSSLGFALAKIKLDQYIKNGIFMFYKAVFILNWEGLYTLNLLQEPAQKEVQYWKNILKNVHWIVMIGISWQSGEGNRNWDCHSRQLFSISNACRALNVHRKLFAWWLNIMKNVVSIIPQQRFLENRCSSCWSCSVKCLVLLWSKTQAF